MNKVDIKGEGFREFTVDLIRLQLLQSKIKTIGLTINYLIADTIGRTTAEQESVVVEIDKLQIERDKLVEEISRIAEGHTFFAKIQGDQDA
ncbi:MAG: hypothetical protein CMQ40_10870 [Gammaproteobacteria bacterium]|nr:hypothetical protein [Gammaproteobacteria bacterium]|tara:strand:+ start:511 stop:783 length:273 start_codon:yes stop_codon:yes gene_type:complete